MSYVKNIKHEMEISRAELAEMLEERYGIDNVPHTMSIGGVMTNGHTHFMQTGASVMISWTEKEVLKEDSE